MGKPALALHAPYTIGMGNPLGTPGHIIRRKDLKPKKPLTDAQLLAQAKKQAEAWEARKRRGLIHD